MPRIALIQMKIVGGQKEANLHKAEELIHIAVRNRAQVIVLPEAMPLGWTDVSAKTDADSIPNGSSYLRLQNAARQHQVFICSGLVENDRGTIYNSAVLIDPQGRLLLLHRKINELTIGREFYQLGDRLQVASTPWGRYGLMICADGFADGQVLSRALGSMGAKVILSPCAWAVPADYDPIQTPYGQLWIDNYAPVSRDFHLWIAGVSNVGWITSGPWKGRPCIGCSLVTNPQGEVALKGPYGVDAETILYLDIT